MRVAHQKLFLMVHKRINKIKSCCTMNKLLHYSLTPRKCSSQKMQLKEMLSTTECMLSEIILEVSVL